MSHGIQKDTYVEADDKTTKALTFDLLNNLGEKLDEVKECYSEHLGVCDNRFKKIEDGRKKDTVVASASGFGGGFLAVAANYIRQLFS